MPSSHPSSSSPSSPDCDPELLLSDSSSSSESGYPAGNKSGMSSSPLVDSKKESVDEADESDELDNPRQSEPRRSDQFSLPLLLLSDVLDSCKDTEEFESNSETEVIETDSGYPYVATGAGAAISSISCGVKPARAKERLENVPSTRLSRRQPGHERVASSEEIQRGV
ncbi:hypothetical protein B0H14DRAFT_2600386 [Mycena olivaceomarginata]|nr:hypothetical protein B0H14DRAFT_2600386 [Mycena olivaceomarginata]